MPRGLDDLKTAFDEQAGSSDGSRELCDLLGLDSSGSSAARKQRLQSLLDGPPSRRRLGWLDLLLQIHAAGAESLDECVLDEYIVYFICSVWSVL